jgi:thiol:disulfide interchange protein
MNRTQFAPIWLLVFALPGVLLDQLAAQEKFEFKLPGLSPPGTAVGSGDGNHIKLTGSFSLQKDSHQGTLSVTAEIDPGWHIYSVTQRPGGPMPSKLKSADSPDYKVTGPFEADRAPIIKHEAIYDVPMEEHEEMVVWTAPIELAEGVRPESLTINVIYSGQVCSDVCIPLFNQKVAATFSGYTTGAATTPPQQPGGRASVAPLSAAALLRIIGFALLGGLILNLMPCVLPVIGLKVLSFVQQGGESRARIFALNLWFVLGLLFVFLLLATAAAFANLSWGQQFTFTWFKVTMVVIVFAFALSFLGVWEVPIPGFAQSASSSKLQQQEGPTGAFFKGVFTTLLATPCSGPFLGPVFGYTLAQPPLVTYIIFLSVGLGMALPYVVIGAFPSLVRWLPKPGAWMEIFKQLMGFVLLFTVVYLFTTINSDYLIPTLALVIGVWLACWIIGRVPIYESTGKQLVAWMGGCAAACIVGYVAFTFLGPAKHIYHWRPY